MAEDRGVLRRIVWRDVFPGVMLFRCFHLAISLPVLFLATVGTLLMPVGPWLSQTVFSTDPLVTNVSASNLVTQPVLPQTVVHGSSRPAFMTWPIVWPAPRSSLQDSYLAVVTPFVKLFDRQASMSQLLGHLTHALWYLLVWSLCGGAITRIAVVRLGCGEQVSLRQSLRHTLLNYGWYASSPLFPLLGVALAVVPLAILGLLMRVSIGVFLAGVLWPLALIGGLIMAILLAGLLLGWLLMWPTISAEEASDSFQAFSNSFSFTFQRPLSYLFYVVIAVLIGNVGGIFVEGFADAMVSLTHWGVSFGLGRERLNQVLEGQLDSSSMIWIGSGLIDLGDRVTRLVASAYYFSFLFCTASAIYLLLRREVDQTDFDEVYIPDQAAEPFTLPTLRSGPHGVPEVEEPPPTQGDRPSE